MAQRTAAGRRPARMALTKAEAADTLGVSVDFFERHVMPELRIVRRGRRRLIPTRRARTLARRDGSADAVVKEQA